MSEEDFNKINNPCKLCPYTEIYEPIKGSYYFICQLDDFSQDNPDERCFDGI